MNKNFFSSHFPAPNFLKMPSFGLDISDGSVRFVELVDGEKGSVLGRFHKVKIPNNVISEGEIKNKIELIKILKVLKKDFDFNFIGVSVIEKNSYIFKTKIHKTEGMTREEIRGILSFKLEENVPIAPKDAVFDFDILKEDKNSVDIVVSVLPRTVVDQFIEVFDEVGLIPLSFEVEAQAVARSTILTGDKGTYMIVDFRSTRVSIAIVSEEIVQFTSTLDIGGDDLVSAIEKHLNISSKEAESVKKDKGFENLNSDDGLFYAMLNTVSALKDEMNKYLIYWHTHKDNTKDGKVEKMVEKIILCGENGALKGLDDYLSLSMGLKVEKANVWKNIFSLDDFIPEIPFANSLEYAAAVGLAMRTDDKIFMNNKLSEE